MRGQHKGRVALGKLKGTIEIDIGDIPALGQRMACDTLKDNSKMACFTWHVPFLVSLLHTVGILLLCFPPSLLSCESVIQGLLRTPTISRGLLVPLWHVPPHTPKAYHQGQER